MYIHNRRRYSKTPLCFPEEFDDRSYGSITRKAKLAITELNCRIQEYKKREIFTPKFVDYLKQKTCYTVR